jgi:hypothetical protein
MGGYVSREDTGTTELRIHGVAGTPPEDMLAHANVERVAGDRTAGFYRRWWPMRPEHPQENDGDSDEDRQEAYSWGALTAASRLRALWLLLLPFLLANVAFFMIPYPPTDDSPERTWRCRKASEALQRIFSVALTCLLVLTAVSVSMDLVAWQCTRPGAANCLDNVSQLRFLTGHFFEQPSRRLAVAALVPLTAVLLLWWLSRTTWKNYEEKPMPARKGVSRAAESQAEAQFVLEKRRLWNGYGPVGQLRGVHVAAGLALTGVLLTAPLARDDRWLGALLLALVAMWVGAIALAALPVTAKRHDPGEGAPEAWRRTYRLLPWVAFALVLLSGTMAVFPNVGPQSTESVGGTRVLPWFSAVFLAVTLMLSVSWLFIATLTGWLAWTTRTRRDLPAAAETDRQDLPESRAWWGLGTPILLLVAWLVAGAYSAGLSLQIANLLGDPVPAGVDTDKPVPLSLPPFYFWAAVGGALIVLLLLAGAFAGYLQIRKNAGRILEEQLPAAFPRYFQGGRPLSPEMEARAKRIARTWAVAGAAETGRVVLGRTAPFVCVVLYVGFVLYLMPSGRALFDAVPAWLVGACVALITVGIVALILLGRAAYKDRNKRRALGVLWDVGTFWPRATHPLAPPSYGERVLPELVNRVNHLTSKPENLVILSGHSQGAVIAAVILFQLDPPRRRQVCLLTYGSPLRRLYSRFFPGYFGLVALNYLGQQLRSHDCEDVLAPRSTWAWRNLYRPSDYIGGPVFRAYPAVEHDGRDDSDVDDNGDVDSQLIDPPFAPPGGDLAWPATRAHSNYFADPAFRAAKKVVRTLRGG